MGLRLCHLLGPVVKGKPWSFPTRRVLASVPFAQCPSARCCAGIVAMGDITNRAADLLQIVWRAGRGSSQRRMFAWTMNTQGEYVGVGLITESWCRE